MSEKSKIHILIGRSLRAARMAAGLSAKEFAEKVNLEKVKGDDINRIERGQQSISLKRLEHILNCLDLDLIQLVTLTHEIPIRKEKAYAKILQSIAHWDENTLKMLSEMVKVMEKYKAESLPLQPEKSLKLASKRKKPKLK